MSVRRLAILGSTGSVGAATLDLLAQSGAEVEIETLTAGSDAAKLAEQALRWRPRRVVIADETKRAELADRLTGSGVAVEAGKQAVAGAGDGASWVMASIVGAAGLAPTLAAARAGAVIALANKESLVCAGPALLKIAREAGGEVIPVDSEHSAIFQVLEPANRDRVSRLVLTASGGPFRTWSAVQMEAASPAQAVAHPNWSMGAKISVDSATMMNKGLEMIEAHYLFDMPPERIDVVVHPQSIIHSLVEYVDGSSLAQLGPPDMRTPIAFALAWPGRIAWPAPPLDLAAIGQLTFEAPDETRFPAIALARSAMSRGGRAPAAFSAANEVAVAAFLAGEIGLLDIARTVESTLELMDGQGELDGGDVADPLHQAAEADAAARRRAQEAMAPFRRRH